MNEALIALNFGDILEKIKAHAASGLGRDELDRLLPKTSHQAVSMQIEETTQALALIKDSGHRFLAGLSDRRPELKKLAMGGLLTADELTELGHFLRSMRLIREHFEKQGEKAPRLLAYASGLTQHRPLEKEVEAALLAGQVRDQATSALQTIRRKLRHTEERMQSKIAEVASSASWASTLQENHYRVIDGRFVLAILAKYKRRVDGQIVSTSSTGATVFVEPRAMEKLRSEREQLLLEDETECYQILATLTGAFLDIYPDLERAIEILTILDAIFAKAKYSLVIQGQPITLNDENLVHLRKARHPLLGEGCVPLDIRLGRGYRTLLITGPNTGGKTVALKTLGLAVLLNQCGVLPPVDENSTLPVFEKLLVDIGDAQDLSQSLSTFSGHMKKLIHMLRQTRPKSLVLVDEIGTGTDPAEGAALAVALLEAFYERGALTMATTHYGELKEHGELHPGFENGSMAFDEHTLAPLYRLDIGQAGQSKGFWISQRLGIDEGVLRRAKAWRQGERTVGAKHDYKRAKEKASKLLDLPTTDFKKGDRVELTADGRIGLFHSGPNEKKEAQVYIDGVMEVVPLRRLKRLFTAEDLYPPGYDLEQLFSSFQQRKLEKDLIKGRFKNLEEVKERLESTKSP